MLHGVLGTNFLWQYETWTVTFQTQHKLKITSVGEPVDWWNISDIFLSSLELLLASLLRMWCKVIARVCQ